MQVKINKRSAYAPIRYEATRPYALSLGNACLAAAKRGESARMAFVGKQLFPLVRAAITKMGQPSGPGPEQSEALNVQVFANFMQGGKVIFDLSKSLNHTLLHTDASDIPCGEIPFPADSFYLHFGEDDLPPSDVPIKR